MSWRRPPRRLMHRSAQSPPLDSCRRRRESAAGRLGSGGHGDEAVALGRERWRCSAAVASRSAAWRAGCARAGRPRCSRPRSRRPRGGPGSRRGSAGRPALAASRYSRLCSSDVRCSSASPARTRRLRMSISSSPEPQHRRERDGVAVGAPHQRQDARDELLGRERHGQDVVHAPLEGRQLGLAGRRAASAR